MTPPNVTSTSTTAGEVGALVDWHAAARGLVRDLVQGRAAEPLRQVATTALDTADADLVTVVTRGPDAATVIARVAVGLNAEVWEGRAAPADGAVTGEVLRTGVPRLVQHIAATHHDGTVVPMTSMDCVLLVPVTDSGGTAGVLTLARVVGRPEFTHDDLERATLFAGQVGLALELVATRERAARTGRVAERDRIADELNRSVVHPLFGIGLVVQAAAGTVDIADERLADQLERVPDDLDVVIRRIRSSVYPGGA